MCNRNIIKESRIMGFGILPAAMTPEFGNALIVIDAIALALFVVIIYSAKIAAGSSRASLFQRSRARVTRATHFRRGVRMRCPFTKRAGQR